jgi:hypothetical protein
MKELGPRLRWDDGAVGLFAIPEIRFPFPNLPSHFPFPISHFPSPPQANLMKFVFLSLLSMVAMPSQASASELDFKRLHLLSQLGVKIYYPANIPARFSEVSIHTTVETDEKKKKHFDYSLSYCDKSNVCFSWETAWCGVGDGPDGDRKISGHSAIFGDFILYVFNPGSEGNGGPGIYYMSEWMEDQAAVHAGKKIGCNDGPTRHFLLTGNGLTDDEAIAVVESVQALD